MFRSRNAGSLTEAPWQQRQTGNHYNIERLLLQQELGSVLHRYQATVLGRYLDRQVGCLRPSTFSQAQGAVDKAFCSAWLDDAHVLVGTKCNKLLCLHVPSHTHTLINYPQQSVYRHGPDLFTGPRHTCGQHAVAVSPDGRFVATGGQHTQDIVLWQVQSSCTDVRRSSTLLRPVQTLMGHVDWIFGLSWISNDQLVSAGRDKTIKLWQVPHAAAAGSHGEYCYQSDDHGAAVMSVKFHKDKVRDIKYDQQQQQLAAVCVDGSISWWSPDLLLQGSYLLPELYEEPVVVQQCGSLLVVGCKQEALLIDTRAGQQIAAAVAVPAGNSSKRRRLGSPAAAVAVDRQDPAAAGSCAESARQMGHEGLQALLQDTQEGGHDVEQQSQQHIGDLTAAAPGSSIGHQQAATQEPSADMLQSLWQQQVQDQLDGDVNEMDSDVEEYYTSDEVVDHINEFAAIPINRQYESIQLYIQQQLQQLHHPPEVHYAYQRAWESTYQQYRQYRIATGQEVTGQQQQGLKRLLHGPLEAVLLPDGVAAADLWIDAQLTGEIAAGDWGVRSLTLQQHLLGIGTGEGDLVFHDMRRMSDHKQTLAAAAANRRLSSPSSLGSATFESPCDGFAAASDGSQLYEDPDPGWRQHSTGRLPARVHKLVLPDAPSTQPDALLVQAGLMAGESLGDDVPSAVYTHCWDPTSMRLFAGGGPLQMGYKGCSLALFQA